MASDRQFVDFILERLKSGGEVTAKSMFGEYGLYLDGKLFALICDNMLFVKPTKAGREFIGEVKEAPPYPGAKLNFLIEDKLSDSRWLSELMLLTVSELPEPKPKKKKQ